MTHFVGQLRPRQTFRGPQPCHPGRQTGLPPHPSGLCHWTAVSSAPPLKLQWDSRVRGKKTTSKTYRWTGSLIILGSEDSLHWITTNDETKWEEQQSTDGSAAPEQSCFAEITMSSFAVNTKIFTSLYNLNQKLIMITVYFAFFVSSFPKYKQIRNWIWNKANIIKNLWRIKRVEKATEVF